MEALGSFRAAVERVLDRKRLGGAPAWPTQAAEAVPGAIRRPSRIALSTRRPKVGMARWDISPGYSNAYFSIIRRSRGRETPRISAARVLWPPVAASTRATYSRSTSAPLVRGCHGPAHGTLPSGPDLVDRASGRSHSSGPPGLVITGTAERSRGSRRASRRIRWSASSRSGRSAGSSDVRQPSHVRILRVFEEAGASGARGDPPPSNSIARVREAIVS